MAKFVSFSLFGSDPKYEKGLLRNLELMHDLLPDWRAVVYCAADVSRDTLARIEEHTFEIVRCGTSSDLVGAFWRLNIVQTHDFTHVLFRDADSRFSGREIDAIQDWIQSGKTLHIIRDHPYHFMPILAGLWGVTQKINQYKIDWDWSGFGGQYCSDQLFLAQRVYPLLVSDSFVHDSFLFVEPHRKRLLNRPQSGQFIGESYDENDQFVREHRDVIHRFIQNPFMSLPSRWFYSLRLRYSIWQTLKMSSFLD